MNQYKIVGRIGQGAHGYVMKGIHRATNQDIALKKLIIKSLQEGIPKNILREVTTLRVLTSEYVVKLLDVVPHGMGLVLVMEFLPLSLTDVMKHSINTSQIKCYMKMLLSGVSYMHENNIMHRDLKPANLLIANCGTLKIADFGLARIYVKGDRNRQYSHQVATRWYRAPELLYGSRHYTMKVDMWAIGCVLAEMVLKRPLFSGETDIEQLAIVLHMLGTPTEESWPGLTYLPDFNKIMFAKSAGLRWSEILPNVDHDTVLFVRGFIKYDQAKRLTAKQALSHPYFLVNPIACTLSEMPTPDTIKSGSLAKDENFDDVFKEFENLLNDF